MLFIVVALFAFCWLPLQTYTLLSVLSPTVNSYRYINIIWFCCNWLAMSNSCHNPFIYGLLSEKFKHAFRVLFRRCPCISRPSNKQLESFIEHSEESVRKSSTTSHDEALRIHINGGRVKRYVRVPGKENTAESFV